MFDSLRLVNLILIKTITNFRVSHQLLKKKISKRHLTNRRSSITQIRIRVNLFKYFVRHKGHEAKYREINEAYSCLSSKSKREEYDLSRQTESSTGGYSRDYGVNKNTQTYIFTIAIV